MNTNFKSKYSCPPKCKGHQEGAVLLVSLVLLVVMTLIGVSNMRSTTLQFNMATNNQSRSEAFNAAEYVLRSVDNDLQVNFADHNPEKHLQTCTGSICYDSTCSGGYCFEGEFAEGELPPACLTLQETLDDTVSPPDYLWLRDNGAIWSDSAKYKTMNVKNSTFEPKYFIEFLCYVDKEATSATCDTATPDNCVAFYRITVLAVSEKSNSKVMLQATTKVY